MKFCCCYNNLQNSKVWTDDEKFSNLYMNANVLQ